MAGIQQRGAEPADTYSVDESPGWPSLPLQHLYALPGDKAAQPAGNDRLRITTVICITGDGQVLPPAFIVYTQVKGDDQTSQRALKLLLADKEFNTDGLWRTLTWSRVLVVPRKGKPVRVEFIRPLLLHPDGRVVWCQTKAYMDCAGMCLYFDTVMGPWRKRNNRGAGLIVWDNCGTHLMSCVKGVALWNGFDTIELPPNMTDILQPVDIIACGPLKAGQRAQRALQLLDYMQEYTRLADAALKKDPNAEPPPYAPPRCTIATCISTISAVFVRNFTTREFAAGVARVFQNVGLTRLDNGDFATYTGHFKEVRLKNRNIFRSLGAEYYVHGAVPGEFVGARLFDDTGPAADDGLFDVDPYADDRCGFVPPTAALETCTLGDEDDGGGGESLGDAPSGDEQPSPSGPTLVESSLSDATGGAMEAEEPPAGEAPAAGAAPAAEAAPAAGDLAALYQLALDRIKLLEAEKVSGGVQARGGV